MSNSDGNGGSNGCDRTRVERRKGELEGQRNPDRRRIDRDRFDDLLARALEVPAPQREVFVNRNCDDPDLCRELLELLSQEEHLDGFLERPAAEVVAGADNGPPVSRDLPEAIGPYRILEQLGEGGMGVVYLAEQDEPVERQLAVKVVRADLTAEGVRERFLAERQALARLSHPYIAQMYEASATEQGFPYFAMELISAEPITSYCDRHKMPIEERLELFKKVCAGVQHAHQRGIIHRDLKPSNILVSEVEGRPLPKLIDFGIAKALDRPLTDVTQLTGLGAVGTPAYMSPESLGLDGDEVDVDTRTDVYALGVVLYELLAGVRPFDLTGASAAQIVKRVMAEEVPRPSVRVAGLEEGERAAVAANRGMTAHNVPRRLTGDLDWIVARATARERDRRYGSAAELADDLERHLRHEPVKASPPSLVYRMGKVVRRHRAAAVATVVALLALVVGVVGLGTGMVRARRAEAEARREAETASETASFLIDVFRSQRGNRARGRTITARELLDQGAERIDTELAGQPYIQGRLATVLGEVYWDLGLFDRSKQLLEKGLAWRREALGDEHREVANTLERLGALENQLGNNKRAVELVSQALAMKRRTLGNHHPGVASSLDWLATAVKGDQAEAAEAMWREALAIRRRLGPDDAETAKLLNNLGLLLAKVPSRYGEAEALYRQALEVRRRELEPDNPYLAHSLFNLGFLLKRRGDLESAETYMREAVEILRKARGDEHYMTAAGRSGLAEILLERGAEDEAEQLRRSALATGRAVFGKEHPTTVRYMRYLAQTLCRVGKMEEGETLARDALAIKRRISEEGDVGIAEVEVSLADCLTKKGTFFEAETLLLDAFPQIREVRGDDHLRTLGAREALVELYEAWGKPEEAEKYRSLLLQQQSSGEPGP